ncbi:hypothetical protein BV898_15317 [Hypsibius exemplaris]|uniref:Uncharacterized protein n=1 Tax=Hypsibius exemplaris TaxID=2072580 RepID=A0A9X6RKL4_HYPEX|nr:hypothetical protein BV898_15317 [Hypsibius exemplaris]
MEIGERTMEVLRYYEKKGIMQLSACTVINWRPYSVSVDRKSATAADVQSSLPVACGSQCDTDSSSLCAQSCAACDGQTVAGADTPVSRRYNLGTTKGTMKFSYQTYSIPDRVTVVYEGKALYDSGCVGTSQSVPISFSGSTKEMRVDVEPNCQGTSGTKWYFTLPCPSPCDAVSTKGQGQVRLMGGIHEIQDGGKVYIDKEGKMPAVTAYYCDGAASVTPNVQWTLTIAAFSSSTVVFCEEKLLRGSGATWKIFPGATTAVQGGQAKLTWTVNQQAAGSVIFQILGTNPTQRDVKTLVTQLSMLWYAPLIAVHETGANGQFAKATGLPIISSDLKGTGIFQLTNPRATCEQTWSWTENVRGGLSLMQSQANLAWNWMNKPETPKLGQRLQAVAQMGKPVPVPPERVGQCVFADGTARTIEDDVAIKMFNGATQNYVGWDNTNREWKFVRLNDYKPGPFNYVERVCNAQI